MTGFDVPGVTLNLSVAVERDKKPQRSSNVASGNRRVLNRKSSFFGLVGRGGQGGR